MTELGIAEVLDLAQVQKILEDFSEATGLATVAVDARGIPVTNSYAFTDFCRQMRADPVRSKLCYGCDAHGGLQSLIEGSPQVYRCHAGLVDFSVPVTEGDKYVGAILCGQVRVPRTDEPRFLTAGSNWRGQGEGLEALYDEVPMSTLSRVAAAAKMLFGLSRVLDGMRVRKKSPDLGSVVPAAPQRPLLTLVPLPKTRIEPEAVPLVEATAFRDSLDAEDLASAVAEASHLLDEVYTEGGDLRDGVARVEDLVIVPRRTAHPGSSRTSPSWCRASASAGRRRSTACRRNCTSSACSGWRWTRF